jgi:SAM domain (Sterile alpha motif)
MHDLAHWLEQLGMSEYAQRFAENDIDLSVLPDPDMQICRIRLSDKTSRLHPRHVVPKPAQAYEIEVPGFRLIVVNTRAPRFLPRSQAARGRTMSTS